MIKIGITGASGNLGKAFTKLCKKKKLAINKFSGDIRNKKNVDTWMKTNTFDAIIHLAAIVPVFKVNSQVALAINVNKNGTKILVNSIIKYQPKLKWFFYSSTSHVYSSSKNKITEKNKTVPSSIYGKTKLLGEKEILKKLKKNNFKFCIGRIFSIIDNENKSFLLNNLKIKILQKKKVIHLENLNHFRDFVSTKQVSEVILKLLNKKFSGIINIGTGKETYLKDIAITMAKKYKKKIIFKDNFNLTSIVSNSKKLKENKIHLKPLSLKKYI